MAPVLVVVMQNTSLMSVGPRSLLPAFYWGQLRVQFQAALNYPPAPTNLNVSAILPKLAPGGQSLGLPPAPSGFLEIQERRGVQTFHSGEAGREVSSTQMDPAMFVASLCTRGAHPTPGGNAGGKVLALTTCSNRGLSLPS